MSIHESALIALSKWLKIHFEIFHKTPTENFAILRQINLVGFEVSSSANSFVRPNVDCEWRKRYVRYTEIAIQPEDVAFKIKYPKKTIHNNCHFTASFIRVTKSVDKRIWPSLHFMVYRARTQDDAQNNFLRLARLIDKDPRSQSSNFIDITNDLRNVKYHVLDHDR